MTAPGGPGSIDTGDSFEERMRALSKLVGSGKITATIEFDQAYAAKQERTETYVHPRGGKAHYLRDALFALYKEHYQRVAMELFRGTVQQRFIGFGDKVGQLAARDAPVELGNLYRSGSVSVKVGGTTIYKRAAVKGRMSRAELNARLRMPRRYR